MHCCWEKKENLKILGIKQLKIKRNKPYFYLYFMCIRPLKQSLFQGKNKIQNFGSLCLFSFCCSRSQDRWGIHGCMFFQRAGLLMSHQDLPYFFPLMPPASHCTEKYLQHLNRYNLMHVTGFFFPGIRWQSDSALKWHFYLSGWNYFCLILLMEDNKMRQIVDYLVDLDLKNK